MAKMMLEVISTPTAIEELRKKEKAAILGMGNPLLDISAEVDQALLDKYELLPGNAILAEEKHQPLFPELAAKPNVKYIAGGATQNSIRVAQWMLQEPGRTAYIGCVGSDDFAQKMKEACARDGVKTAYKVDAATHGHLRRLRRGHRAVPVHEPQRRQQLHRGPSSEGGELEAGAGREDHLQRGLLHHRVARVHEACR